MKQVTKYALIITLMVMVHQTKSQENKTSFSLPEAVEYSLKHSPNYLNAEMDLQSADYRRKEITGLGLPQINGSVDIKDYLELPTSLLPLQAFDKNAPPDAYQALKFGTKYNTTAGLSVSQLLFNSDYIFGVKASKEFMNLSKIAVARSKAELTSQVAKAYYMVLISNDRIKLLDANIVKLKKIYDDTKISNEQGFVELIDVERLEVQYNNLITEKEKALRLGVSAELVLKFQMGYNINEPVVLTDSLQMENEVSELSSSNLDVTQRPEFKLLQAQQTLYDIDVKRLKWGYMPTLSAYGSYQFNTQRNSFDFATEENNPSKQWYRIALIGVTLNVSIFDGLQRHNKIQQAKITSLKNQNALKLTQTGAELEASVAGISYNNAYKSMLSQKRNMELADHVYETARKKYQSGVGSNIEVITAETSLKEAQTNYLSAVYEMLVAKIDYKKATGTLIK